jgi:hypothetical protein
MAGEARPWRLAQWGRAQLARKASAAGKFHAWRSLSTVRRYGTVATGVDSAA